MSDQRRDYIGECNEQGVPYPQFQEMFCHRCVQPECVRSAFGKSKFDQRVNTWYERLFQNVPKMGPEDPRYATISAQKFLTIDTGPVPVVNTKSEWRDPRDIVEPVPTPPSILQPPPPAPSSSMSSISAPKKHLPLNTPFKTGQMLGGRPAPEPQPAKDLWDKPVSSPQTDSSPVVKPGVKIKLGGGV